jgi:hypothetical protein
VARVEVLVGYIDTDLFLEVFDDGLVEDVFFVFLGASDGGLDGCHH